MGLFFLPHLHMFLVAFFLALRERSGRRQPPAERRPCIILVSRNLRTAVVRARKYRVQLLLFVPGPNYTPILLFDEMFKNSSKVDLQPFNRSYSQLTFFKFYKIHYSCEIEDYVETHLLQAVCDTPISRAAGCVSLLRI